MTGKNGALRAIGERSFQTRAAAPLVLCLYTWFTWYTPLPTSVYMLRISSVVSRGCVRRKRMSCDMSVYLVAIRSPTWCRQKPVALRPRVSSAVRRYDGRSSLGPTRRCNAAALLLTSLTDFANKIGDQRSPADAVRPQADHYPILSGFI